MSETTRPRSRRSTAGNKMQALLAQEHERLQAQEGGKIEEEEDDVDYVMTAEVKDVFDWDFDLPEEEPQEEGEEAGGVSKAAERDAREEEAKERRRKEEQRRRILLRHSGDMAMHLGTKSTQHYLEKVKKEEGEGIGHGKEKSSEKITSSPVPMLSRRTSSRAHVREMRMEVDERLEQDRLRQEAMAQKKKRKEEGGGEENGKPKGGMSQAERFLEAKRMERLNEERLKQWEAWDEERRVKGKGKRKRGIQGPYWQFRSFLEARESGRVEMEEGEVVEVVRVPEVQVEDKISLYVIHCMRGAQLPYGLIQSKNPRGQEESKESTFPYRDPVTGDQYRDADELKRLRSRVSQGCQGEGAKGKMEGKRQDVMKELSIRKLRDLEGTFLDQAPSLEETSRQAESVVKEMMRKSEERRVGMERRRMLEKGRMDDSDGAEDEEEDDEVMMIQEDEDA
ncbi:YL1 nuclear protein-domain-containing protein [Piptocephalis cylindrospora]|uniref:YL1 nuclear protein-domain-containing protein n=1 Tax=Piptocephalis cylindrospora TaxID=1907219 RepID=A0A4P9Y3M6_9FUNG|nr:YL1 nuclear protein-domain-containing protein [Piptocephalis cylindrospora]|eukprot:RKP13527.1 YL1 nuclear protein-domain-containing protein [Piptocephalis cylindrospora]